MKKILVFGARFMFLVVGAKAQVPGQDIDNDQTEMQQGDQSDLLDDHSILNNDLKDIDNDQTELQQGDQSDLLDDNSALNDDPKGIDNDQLEMQQGDQSEQLDDNSALNDPNDTL